MKGFFSIEEVMQQYASNIEKRHGFSFSAVSFKTMIK